MFKISPEVASTVTKVLLAKGIQVSCADALVCASASSSGITTAILADISSTDYAE